VIVDKATIIATLHTKEICYICTQLDHKALDYPKTIITCVLFKEKPFKSKNEKKPIEEEINQKL
jgi:hypothetical protein